MSDTLAPEPIVAVLLIDGATVPFHALRWRRTSGGHHIEAHGFWRRPDGEPGPTVYRSWPASAVRVRGVGDPKAAA